MEPKTDLNKTPDVEATFVASMDATGTLEKDEDNKAPETLAPISDGKFFSYATSVLVLVNVVIGMFVLMVRLVGYGWSRLPVAVVQGLTEEKDEPRASSLVLDIHAFVAVVGIVMAVLQATSTLFFQKTDGLSRKLHRANGHVLFAVWMFCTISGYAYSLTTSRIGHESENETIEKAAYMSFFWWGGFGILANGFVGYRAIAFKPQEQRDYLLHKSAMFFFMFWGLASGSVVGLISCVQLFLPHCLVDGFLGIFLHLVGLSGQIGLFMGTMHWYDPALWKHINVRMNLAVLAVFVLYFAVLTVMTVIMNTDSGKEHVCI